MKRLLTLLLCLALVLGMSAVMAGCGGSSDSGDASADTAAEETADAADAADDESALYGSWIARTVTYEGQEMDAYDFFNKNTVSWYLAEDGDATIWVGQNHALVTWAQKDGGITMKGDLEYDADFTDDTKTALMWHYDVNDIQAEVLLEHYIEEEEETAE